jgi:hypothetical protein
MLTLPPSLKSVHWLEDTENVHAAQRPSVQQAARQADMLAAVKGGTPDREGPDARRSSDSAAGVQGAGKQAVAAVEPAMAVVMFATHATQGAGDEGTSL